MRCSCSSRDQRRGRGREGGEGEPGGSVSGVNWCMGGGEQGAVVQGGAGSWAGGRVGGWEGGGTHQLLRLPHRRLQLSCAGSPLVCSRAGQSTKDFVPRDRRGLTKPLRSLRQHPAVANVIAVHTATHTCRQRCQVLYCFAELRALGAVVGLILHEETGVHGGWIKLSK